MSAAWAADDFKSSKFLTYSAEAQNSYIVTSVVMAGAIAGQNRPEQAKCIDRWMAENESAGFPTVKDAMSRFPEHHPSGVIIAVLEKACGSVRYAGK
ncbi:hypothetical protein [Hyphomicrobium sp.]|uniref:hypothetical protein n=1 Tax=Hyphomicrobium sp. TaxID=82 RepID=UPI002FDFEB52